MEDGRGAAHPTDTGIRLSLKAKLSLLIISLVVLTVVLVGLFLLREQQQSLTVEMTKRGRTIAENFAASAKTPLVTGDELTLVVLVKDAMKDPDVAYAFVVDTDGKILAQSDASATEGPMNRPKDLAPLKDELLIQTYVSAGRRVIDFAVPLVYSRVPVGALYLGFSQRSIDVALAKARNQAMLITFLMIAAGVGGAVGLATLLSRPIFRLVEGTRAIAAGDFNVALPVPSRDEIGVLTESFNQMARSLREKEMIKRAFTRYVAREVVEEILKDPERLVLTGERREVTVLFCDVRGFTPLSERLSPEEVVALLNDKRAQQGKEGVTIGIGVSAGEAVAGTVGTEDRMEYTVIGDSVNLAARLESNAKPGQILISHRTWENVHDAVETRSLGIIKVKGKEEQVEVYEVLGVAGSGGRR